MSGTDVAGLISAMNNKDSGSFGENWIWIIGLLIVAGIFGEDNDTYIKMTKLWLNDTDSVEDKVYQYFCNIPKED